MRLLILAAGAVVALAVGRCDHGSRSAVGSCVPPDSLALEIRFLDVGQGDAAVLRSAGKVALIDAGPLGTPLRRRLRDLGVQRVDLAIVSHNHTDHFGGLLDVLGRMPVAALLDNGRPAPTPAYRRLLAQLERSRVVVLRPERRTLQLGDARLRVIPPPLRVRGDPQNNRSLLVYVDAAGVRALFPGDAEREQQAYHRRRRELEPVAILKAAHHGSSDAVSAATLAVLRPRLVVLSLGRDNPYGHPHREALRLYCRPGRWALRTDQEGDIVVRIDRRGRWRVATARRGELGAAPEPRRQPACAGLYSP